MRSLKKRHGSFKCQDLLKYCTDINESGITEQVSGESLLYIIYRNNSHTVENFKDEITATVENVSEETLVGVMENFSQCLQMMLDAQGSYLEYVFT
jgi:hypothetical protein